MPLLLPSVTAATIAQLLWFSTSDLRPMILQEIYQAFSVRLRVLIQQLLGSQPLQQVDNLGLTTQPNLVRQLNLLC